MASSDMVSGAVVWSSRLGDNSSCRWGSIQWHFAEDAAAEAARNLLQAGRISGIEIITLHD